ncbi:MAG: hypothetical protein BWY31_03548 [Lentisphaerae bacterium ADurb.Bin242]|nr:MAG: hypothetical protein BWY31_03548 [Lentisphaerae bacterium ADurb.Bin242]
MGTCFPGIGIGSTTFKAVLMKPDGEMQNTCAFTEALNGKKYGNIFGPTL